MDSGPTTVRSLGPAVWISIGIHVLLGGAVSLARYLDAEEERELPRAPSIEIVVVEPEALAEPMAVAMLDEAQLASLTAASEPALPREPTRQPRVAATTRSATSAAGTETEAPLDPRAAINPLFAMRSSRREPAPPQIDLRLPRRDPADYAPRGEIAVEPPPSGELEPSGGGSYRSNKGSFTARVNPDGTVDLKSSRNLRISVPDPRKIPRAVGKHVADWAANDNKIPDDPEKVAINNNRAPDRDTRPDHGKATVPVLGGGFDITDALMRRKKVDPYAAAKLRYLDSTRDERVQIGRRYKQQQLARSAQLMQKQLDLLVTATIAQKKQALFELWDDCAETGEAAVVEGGKAARALVIGYIRTHLTGANAYTAAELELLDKRKLSKARFAPY